MAKKATKGSKDTLSKRELDNKKLASKQFPIVGIGASAGGLEALESFFNNTPDNTGMAFVIVQHLDPNHIGIMPELLQRITSMKVNQIADNMQVLPNTLYIIPPNKSLSLLKGKLHLFDPVESHGLRLPIDIFFRSLASDQKEKSIGIILSGMGSDGSLGIKSIKENNGLVLVQEPSSAKFDGMPNSAIKSVTVDIVAPVNQLSSKLVDLLKVTNTNIIKTNLSGEYTNSIAKVIILLREKTGHDFSQYKKSTLYRRIERRKGVHKIKSIRNYVRYIQENPEEIDILFRELLIGVTSFFRDKNVWEKLMTTFIPKLLKNKTNVDTVRIWVPACSTGEEVFSLAIIFCERLEKLKSKENISLQLFATDIDSNAIAFARKAWYSKNSMIDVSDKLLKKYFKEENNGYRIVSSIRELVIFATHNVIKDPPFTKLDMISCRNMLIYMEPELQSNIISLFNYSLNHEGIMLLGTAESLGQNNMGFKVEDSKNKVFRRLTENPLSNYVDFPSLPLFDTASNKRKVEYNKNMKGPANIKLIIDQIIIQNYAPSAIIVNDSGDIIYISGRTGKYIEPASGKANWNIFAMAREGLRQELPNAFRKVSNSNNKVNINNLKIGINGGTQIVDIVVQKLDSPELISGLILIVITDTKEIDFSDNKVVKKKITSKGILGELEIELQQVKDELKRTREEMQSSQEELKSANEELQSTNEELQSTNEELTTSKEEMQSLNEELQTVNSELQSKVNDHLRASDDMKNLLNSIEVATLFLDKNLNIRRFTNQLTDIFKIRPSDIGRQFTDLVSTLKYPEIDKHARLVLDNLVFREVAVETTDNSWYGIKIMPYRTIDDRIDGLVITFTNITKAKELELQLIEANKKLSSSQ